MDYAKALKELHEIEAM